MDKHENEYELLYMIAQKDVVAWNLLIDRYSGLIDYKISEVIYDKNLYYQQRDDLRQQGLILLYECLETYDNQRNAKFSTFFSFCFERKIRNLLRSLYHNGGMYINAISLDQTLDISNELTVGENIVSTYSDYQPEHFVMYDDLEKTVKMVTSRFSTLEQDICQLKQSGYSYQEIMDKLSCNYKKIDNTMQKFRKSLNVQLLESGLL